MTTETRDVWDPGMQNFAVDKEHEEIEWRQ